MSVSNNKKMTNQSVSKIMTLLSALAKKRVPVHLQELVADTQMPAATLLRYLNVLMADGYVFQESISSRYALTWKICDIGEQVHSNMNLRIISSDIISNLSCQLNFGICLVIERNMECMYLDCIYEPNLLDFSITRIGKQAPLHATSSGKMLLTAHTENEIHQLIKTKGLERLTERTITKEADLFAELEHIRKVGYSLDDEECEMGLRCVAAPIYASQDRLVAAVSTFSTVDRITDDCIQNTILPMLKAAADKISSRLG